ncbi:RICIN domain-containing protein [Allohahella sp. A8]|uniref:RICIN domain-containing protein n=1 Tax=Allohahella sp. A8 TaxID=3141461 RepID=UPI003A810BB8
MRVLTPVKIVAASLFLLTLSIAAHAGFTVSASRLVDGNGNTFVMRGVNVAHAWYPQQTNQSLANIASRGANTVRVVLSNGVLWSRTPESQVRDTIAQAKSKGLIAVLEVHDTTGYGEQTASTINQAVDYWLSIKNALVGQEDYVIINIANEPFGNHQPASAWVNGHMNAIKRLRDAGLNHTLMVDAANWGQDWQNIMRNNAQTVFNSDPRRNTIFSVHMYDVYQSDQSVSSYLDSFKAKGLHLVVGEFAADHFGKYVAANSVMYHTRRHGYGYIGWSWSGNSSDLRSLDIVSNFSNNLTPWGNMLFNDGENGIVKTSKKASVFTRAPTTPGTPVGTIAGRYTLQAMHSGKCLDVYAGSMAAGASLTQWDCHWGSNQQFDITNLGDGTYAMRAVHSGKVVDLDWGRTVNGTNILQWDWSGANNQRWIMRDEGNGYYSVRAKNNANSCMDVTGGYQSNGANVQLWACNGNPQQRWKLFRR